MRTRLYAVLTAALALVVSAPAVVAPLFPATLPANTVWGRLGIGSGPGQAIPFGTLFGNLFNGGSAPTAHGVLIGEGTAALNAVTMADAQLLFGQTGADPAPKTVSGDLTFTDTGAGTIAAGAVTGSKIAAGTVANSNLATAPANTMKGNWTASTAAPADNTIPSCPDNSGNHLNYVNGTGVICGVSSIGAAMVLLNTITASNSATLSDTTSLTNTYSQYEIVFENIIPATDEQVLEFQIHSGGAFKATGYVTSVMVSNQGTLNSVATVTTYMPLSNSVAGGTSSLSNAAPGLSGRIRIFTPSTSGIIMVGGDTFYSAHTGAAVALVNGYWNTAGVVDGFQVLMNSGNITSGVIKIYGIT